MKKINPLSNQGFIKTFRNIIRKSPKDSILNVPEGLCPNCWGTQEYQNEIREMFKDRQINVNNHEENYAFIQAFVVKHVDGIRLKKGKNSLECPTCKRKK